MIYICGVLIHHNISKMKKLICFLMGICLVVGLFSCGGPIDGPVIDETLLYGKWQEGSVFERYESGGLGATWDVGDDVGEEEAQLFKWSLDGSTLVHEYVGTFVVVPKVYTITTLNSTQLIYQDDYGTTHNYSRVD